MKKITKILLVVIMGIITVMPYSKASAKDAAKVYLFYGSGCQYCEAAMSFFESIEEEYGEKFDLVKYEVWYDEDNSNLMQEVANELNQEVSGVPFIVIGEEVFKGYSTASDSNIKEAIDELYSSDDRYDVIEIVQGTTTSPVVYIASGIVVVGFISLLAISKAKAN